MANQVTSLKLTVKATEYCYNSRYQFLSPALTSKVMLKISVMTESYVIYGVTYVRQKIKRQKVKRQNSKGRKSNGRKIKRQKINRQKIERKKLLFFIIFIL